MQAVGGSYDRGLVDESPIAQLLGAVDRLDSEAVIAQFAPDARVLVADGRQADGIEAVRELLTGYLASLRSATHSITAEWHQGDVWIAEFEATYELQDWLQTSPLPRAMVMRRVPDGIAELRVYGAHERQLGDRPSGGLGTFIRGRWIPPV